MPKQPMKKPMAKKTVTKVTTKKTVARPMAKKTASRTVVKRTAAKPKASSSSRTSVGAAQRKDKNSVDNIWGFRNESDFITGAPDLDVAGWNRDINTLAKMAKKYKLAKTDKQARAVAFKALEGWETQVGKNQEKPDTPDYRRKRK